MFIPWKHDQKELKIITKTDDVEDFEVNYNNNIITRDYWKKGKDYNRYTDLKVENYKGYDFICKNQSFIADLYFGEENKCL